MNISTKKRKVIHFLLFILIITLQIAAFSFWYSETKDNNKLFSSLEYAIKPNEAIENTNEAWKNYFEANNYFNEFLGNNSINSYNSYQNSLKEMSLSLNKLSLLSNKNNLFGQIVKSKKVTEKEIIKLQSQLDLLMKKNYNNPVDINTLIFKLKSYNYDEVLSSITYDTTKTNITAKKKGFFGRIGSAIAGENQVDKQEVQSVIKMVFNNQEKSGSFEEQLKNVFKITEKYYTNEFVKLRKNHFALKTEDQDLIKINKIIFTKSQEILLFYTNSAQESSKIEYLNSIKNYGSNLKSKQSLVFILFIIISFITLLLLTYTVYSYIIENKLEKAKLEAEINLDKKNQLIGLISHEMRVPLTIISNFSQKIKNNNTNTALNQDIDSLHFTSHSLQITVSQILDFFKNENKTLTLYKTKINLKKEITSILESLQSLAEVKKIKIIANTAQNLDEKVWTDSVKIHQLLYNIVGNAIKFTQKGTITVDSTLTPIGEQFRFDVKITDTGSGIPKEEQDKIFNKFYQSKIHKEQISFGAGLGLALCKNIIELFQGEIKVTSELNIGTQISFFLLLDKINVEQISNQNKLINLFKNTSKEVLAIDDDPITLILIKKLISKINFKITTFQDVQEAKIYLEKQEVDIIISDLKISNYSGLDFIKEIKKIENNNATKPIILVTGDSYMEASDLKSLQIDEILIKPINKEELYSKILKVLHK